MASAQFCRYVGCIRWQHLPVLTNCFCNTHASEALYASKSIKTTVLHPAKRQRLAHVGCCKVINAGHASLQGKGLVSIDNACNGPSKPALRLLPCQQSSFQLPHPLY